MTGWVSLTFDDALDEHLDHALPALNDAGLRGTFYTHLSSLGFLNRQSEWRQAAADGHELGNHTVFHPADLRKNWVRPGNAIDYYSVDRMKLELEFANASLSSLDGRVERTFAYPCCNSFVGTRGWVRRTIERAGFERTRVAGWIDRWNLDLGSTLQSYEATVEELFIAGRGGGLVLGQQVPQTATWRRSKLPSAAVVSWTIDELRAHVTNAVDAGTWAILQFHGIGGGHWMDCRLSVFCEFVSWLMREYASQVITVLDGARRLWGQDATIHRDNEKCSPVPISRNER